CRPGHIERKPRLVRWIAPSSSDRHDFVTLRDEPCKHHLTDVATGAEQQDTHACLQCSDHLKIDYASAVPLFLSDPFDFTRPGIRCCPKEYAGFFFRRRRQEF